jgi:hypothetical protein
MVGMSTDSKNQEAQDGKTIILRETDARIKKAITETIVEELFRDLGLFILQFGHEHTLNPVSQLEDFIRCAGGSFNLVKKDKEFVTARDYIGTLPDFLFVHTDGSINFLEVKYRYDGILWDKDLDVFETYPHTIMLVVNTSVSDDIKKADIFNEKPDPEILKGLINSRFHIYFVAEKKRDGGDIIILPLRRWLQLEYGISKDHVLERYETLVPKWIPDQRGK